MSRPRRWHRLDVWHRWDWRHRLLDTGEDPDPRFTLANERTFLAWIRTSLALTAGGVGLEAFTGNTLPPVARLILSIVLLGLGTMLAGMAFTRWFAVERAMRLRRQLPLPLVAPLLAIGVALAGLALVWLLATR